MTHLEDLIYEYYDLQDYLVKKNIKVGKLSHGGWEMELDIVAYNPHSKHLIHIEPSIDALAWETREARYTKKFTIARKYILREVFTWLPETTPIEQIAILINHPANRSTLAGGRLMSIDEFVLEVKQSIVNRGITAQNAIPEQYPMLRTLQLALNGYFKVL